MKESVMPLLDHFHPPLFPTRTWESMHALWSAELVGLLNESVLPAGYYAEAQVHIGSRVEVDVATLGEELASAAAGKNGPGGTMTATRWAPPVPALVMPATFPDEIEIQVLGGPTGGHLVAAIELVSPGNKDRVEARRSFAGKCAAYLQTGVGLIVVDVVTDRQANLHDELIDLLEKPEEFHFPGGALLYAVAYRPARRDPGGDQIDIWPVPLAVGDPLPTLPLALRGAVTVPVDLEAAYAQARKRSRL
jgi:hypothetical protein